MPNETILATRDKILSELAVRGGSMPHRAIACRMKMNRTELDPVLEELELEHKISRTNLKVGGFSSMRQIIILRA